MRKQIMINIANIKISVSADDEGVQLYLLREFELLLSDTTEEKVDITVEIINQKFELSAQCRQFEDNIYVGGKDVFIPIKAHFRTTWIQISDITEETICVKVYLYKTVGDCVKKILAPNFQYPWQNSVLDFFHGMFLWLLDYKLLQHNSTLIHAAAYADDNAAVIAADSASGKTTLIDELIKKKGYQYIAEDYCIVDSACNVYGIFNQRRVLAKDAERKGLLDFINYFLFSCVKKMHIIPIRIRSTGENYYGSKIAKNAFVKGAIYLMRTSEKDVAVSDAGECCCDVMRSEVFNWDGCKQWLGIYDTMYPELGGTKTFFEEKNKIIMEFAEKSKMRICNIPYMETKELFIQEIYKVLDTL